MRGHRQNIVHPFFQYLADVLDLDPTNDWDLHSGILVDVSGEMRHDPSSPIFILSGLFRPPVIQTRLERRLFRHANSGSRSDDFAPTAGHGWGVGWESRIA